MNHRLLFHSAVAVATLLAAPASAGLLKGPYIQMLGKTGVTIVWETHGNASGTVEWGADSSLGTSVAAAAGTMHEVRIDGLSQDTTYFYRVVSDGETSPTYRFSTAPPASQPLRVVLMGDSRSGTAVHGQITQAVLEEAPDIYMNSGDIVGSGEIEMDWQEHFDIERELMATTPMLPVIGNHDTDGLKYDLWEKYFVLPRAAEDGTLDEYRDLFYFLDWGPVRFIGVDTQISHITEGSAQHAWFLETLQDAADNPDILHIIVGVHVPPFTAKPGRSNNTQMVALVDTMVEYNVTLVVAGHDHHYYRSMTPDGLNQIVTGGGGAGLYDCVPSADYGMMNYVCDKTHNYVVLDINGAEIQGTAKTQNGDVIDTFTWVSKKTPVDGTPGDDPGDTGGDDQGPTVSEYDPDYGFSGCAASGTTGWGGALLLGLALVALRALRRHRDVERPGA